MCVTCVILVIYGFGGVFTSMVSDKFNGASHPGLSKLYVIPSTFTLPFTLVIVMTSVAAPIVNGMCCIVLLGPALKLIVFTPSEIVTFPAFEALAILIVITVPTINSSAKVKVATGLAEFIVVQFVVFAGAPTAEIAPTELLGFNPPAV